ncbi:TPA: hypothetical protein ACTYQH_003723 [Klebsiella michiganensis]|uniref:hypothetical protein n=1 Tax=Klebsiella michiganensis TaxID=1134687 RepID=UPI00254A88EF|nr:hypothetical protein [Klebsiella michiganensis]ELK6574827.1 hypothetical protein [Klebsiella michiganensis]MDK9842064.1 hypothetical protein [Klebsiella michiganensis]
MRSKLLFLSICCFSVMGCSSESRSTRPSDTQHITYVGCNAKFGDGAVMQNKATIVDQGSSFIVRGSAGDFYSGDLVFRSEKMMTSEPSGGLVFSKGLGEFSKTYLVHMIQENKVSVFDCTSAIVKQ